MEKQSNIFNLIKSLSKGEKRFFHIFAKRHTIGETNNYQVLFNIINQQKKDDNSLIIKNLKKSGQQAKYLSAEKNYLFQAILKSLTVFHNDDSYGIKLKNQLQAIEILFYKGLYKECLKLIQSAEKTANSIENFPLLLDTLTWKKKCLGYSKGLVAAASVRTSILQCIQKIENLQELVDLYYISYALHINEGKADNALIVKEFNRLIKNPLLKSEKSALSYTAKIYFYLIFEHYYYAINNNRKELESLENITKIIATFPLYSTEQPLDYISIYNRILSLKKYIKTDTFYDEIAVLKKLTSASTIRKDVIEQRVFVLINTNELEFLLISHQFEKSILKVKELEKQLSHNAIEIEPFYMIHFYYLYALTLFNAGQFNKALDYINIIINNYHLNDRPAVFIKTEILNALSHFELNNIELSNQLSKRIKKKYYHKELLSTIEYDLINVLSRNNKTLIEKKTFKPLFIRINEKSQRTDKKYMLQNNYLIENYLQWIQAYLNNTSVLQQFQT